MSPFVGISHNDSIPADHIRCHTCGKTRPGNEYHPHAFCVLYKAGYTNRRVWETIERAVEARDKTP
jgi:hypothetical protein